ncbi:hypothetical protein [Rufibacter hautae]|nr:hypothetical protein [Rufibacter hautae]
MKRLLTFLMLLLPFLAMGQDLPIDKETGKVNFTEVVPVES